MKGTVDTSVGERYKYLQKVLAEFWKRWSTEYLPKLQERSKWRSEEDPLRPGDVVLVTEDNTARPTWPMGLVTEMIAGKDGIQRTARVKTKKGTIVRPVQRLHLLERADLDSDPEPTKEIAAENATETVPDALITPLVDQGGEDVVEPQSGLKLRSGLVYQRC